MGILRGRVRPWVALGVALAILGVILDGTAAGVVLVASAVSLFVAVIRALSGADMSGVSHGGGQGGMG